MKVCRVITRMNIGGPARQVIELAKDSSYETNLIVGLGDRSEGDMCLKVKPRITIHIIPSLRKEINLKRDYWAFRNLYRIFKREKPDVVHTHMAKAGMLGRLAAFLARVPVRIHTFHGHTFYGYWGKWKTRLFRFLEWGIGFVTTKIIAVSESQKEELVRYIGHRKKITVIMNGFNFDRFINCRLTKKEAREILDWPKNKIIYGFVGRLAPVKNVDAFITFASLANIRNDNYYFVVVGDGPERYKIPSWIRREDWKEDIEVVYGALDYLVITSKNEGTPTTILEAKVSECKIICKNLVGGIKDIINMNREEVLEQYNPDRLRNDIRRLYELGNK